MQADPPSPDQRRNSRVVFEADQSAQRELSESLHNTVCQTLGGASLMAGVLAARLKSGGTVEAAELEHLGATLEAALDEIRALSRTLQPLPRTPEGLMTALARLAQATEEKASCEFVCEEPVLIHDREAALTLYLVAREGVKHAIEHARATAVTLSLAESDGHVALTIRDNSGASASERTEEAIDGLEIMRCRANSIGATLAIEPKPGTGTSVVCTLPKTAKCSG